MRKLLKTQGFAPEVLVTAKLRSYVTAVAEVISMSLASWIHQKT
jgi:hypothetical protein